MRESPIYQRIVAEAEAEGEARDEARGKTENFITVLETRFGAMPNEPQQR